MMMPDAKHALRSIVTPVLNGREQGDLPAAAAPFYLGRARVVARHGHELLLCLPHGEEVSAELALAYGYVPQPDDELVVVGEDGRYFVVGLMRTHGALEFSFFGDVRLHARDGELQLVGDRGVDIRGDDVVVRAQRIELWADTLVEKANTMVQRVRGWLNLQSGDKLEIVDGQSAMRAKRAHLTSAETVRVNGKEIHLG